MADSVAVPVLLWLKELAYMGPWLTAGLMAGAEMDRTATSLKSTKKALES
jgi:hypothetical protein